MRSDIVEIGVLDDLLDVSFWLREEDSRHDDPLDLVDTELRMTMRFEPMTGNLDADEFIFAILFREACVMEETSNLEILEVFTIDSLSESNIGSPITDLHRVIWIVVWIGLTLAKNIHDIGTCLFDQIHRVRFMM